MVEFKDGIYTLSYGALRAGLSVTEKGTFAVGFMGDITAPPDEKFQWEVKTLDNGNVTLQNVAHKLYLSYVGIPVAGIPVIGTKDGKEWALKLLGFSHYMLLTLGGTDENPDFAFSFSWVPPEYPPKTQLVLSTNIAARTLWLMKALEDSLPPEVPKPPSDKPPVDELPSASE
ncbi:hypothetical protein M422DRAFT_254660 [Sphaerobolus stellatus SS14]|uniref:Uncharacterized protein n=1 Tax=Sphaerobolus stellatus (strain SS14) TaxID=990650 RepID=A0A0C9UGP8_SPHS4|nr:hypothetical protein M422DRAFT_254660 [Sphaerobolus stellatus SS14]